jgi:EmrB/QacA subfamily drug resistance transporter
VILGYTLSLAVWIPASGWLGDRIGTKKTFMFAFIAFTLGSLLCATAQTMSQLIAFRIIQGVGGGMLTPVGVAMLFRAFPPTERARVSTIIMVPVMLAPAMGPILGGLLVTHANWRWIFLVNVPIGVVGIAFGLMFLREHREPTAGRFDVPGFVLSGAALALIVYALSDGPRSGWSSTPVVTTAVLGVVLAIAVVWVELRTDRPLLDLRLLHDRLFRQCNLLSLLSTMSFLGLTFVMPLYLQLFRGMDALESGLTTFPQALGVLISGQIAGRLYMHVGPRRLMTGGLFAAGLVIVLFTRIEVDTNLWLIRALMLLRGFCMGFAFVPMQAASYATIDPRDNGRASSIFSVQRQVGVSLGVAILASVLASYMSLSQPVSPDLPAAEVADVLFGYRLAFGLAVAFAWAAALAAFFVRDSDAAETMRPRQEALA